MTKADLEGLELIITVDGAAKTLAVSSATDFSSGGTNYGIYREDSSHGYRLYDWAGKTVTVQLRTPVVDDCAGDTTTTCSVSLGSSVTGDIELVDDRDYFSLSVTSGAGYQIDAEGSETSMGTLADPFLTLRDASGTELVLNDDGGTGRNARIVWAAISTRTVYVDVSQVFHDSTGTYTLTVSVGPADDCANDTTTTCSVSPGTPVTGDIQYSGDDDYFSLSVASGVTYQIDAEGSPTSMGTLTDPYLELRDPSNAGTAINDDGGTGFNARLTWTASNTLTVYVAIRSADGGTGTYTLTVSVSNNLATGAPTISGTAQVGQTLTAATSGIMDSDGLATPGYTYQWIRVDGGTEADISGATSSTYTLVVADQGKTIKVKVSFTDDASNAETLTSAATTTAAAAANTAPDAPSAPRVAVSATDVRAITVEWDEPANNGAAITDYDVQYQRDDETVWHNASHTGTGRTVTISNLLLGYGYRVQVRATNSAGTSAWSASGSGATESNTAATGKPTISGTLLVGETLTVDTSGITDADGLSGVSYGYQWRRDGADITGANSMTYTLAVADAGAAISVEVSFTDGGSFDEVLTSDATTTVAAAANTAPDAPGAPRVAVSATDVRAITVEWDEPANNGAAITDYDVQYQRDDETVWHNASHTGTGRTVTISNLLLGYGYRVQVRATNSAGTSAWSASGSGATESNTAATGKPTISGTLLVGETLTVDTSGITDADGLSGVSYGYQWRRDGADITGANSMTYTLAVADAGAAISVEVSFTDGGSFDEVLTSDATTTVAAAANTAPDAPGAPRVAVSATDVRAITVEWDEPANNGAAITDYDVQYQRDDETVWHNASHTGTGRTVTISNLLLGYGYRVQVRATNSAGTSAWSASGSGATESNTAATGKPTISGTLLVGETLTVDTSGITDADGLSGVSYGYQWRRDGADITGANSMTYTLAVADAGAAISVEVSFTDDGSFDEVLTSDATTTVAAANNPCANNTTTTCSVSPGSSVTGNIEVASDVDYFRLSVTSGLTYQIDMEGSPTSMGTLANPFIRLRDATVNSIDSDDNGGTGLNCKRRS